jgi:glycerate 2-kinase
MTPPDPATSPRDFLRALFDRAVAVADPMASLAQHLPPRPKGRVLVVGAGKASARMAEAVEAAWCPCEGLVITRHGHGRPTAGITVIEASHPVPDEAGVTATQTMLTLMTGLQPDDFVLCLISGGASALLSAPRGLALSEKQQLTQALLASGAPIADINLVRKHLSAVKGGQLAAAAFPARMLCLMISDVPGDDPAVIGSGPTVAEASRPEDAAETLRRWGLTPPPTLADSTVVAPGDPRLSAVENRVIAAPQQSLQAAKASAEAAGCTVHILGDAIQGEARHIAALHAAGARALAASLMIGDKPLLLLSGGELTVTKTGDGIGGPNAEYALALSIALMGYERIFALAADTDGVDGAAEVAGAFVTPDTLARSTSGAVAALDNNDAHSFFAALGDQLITGPTLTNVNDFRAILILPPVTPNAYWRKLA